VARCRRALAGLLGGVPEQQVVFTLNATMALNIAIGGMGLKVGDGVVTSAAEHNSVLRPLEKLRREDGVRVDIVPVDKTGTPDEARFSEALAREPKLVVLSHASNVTGRVMPVGRLLGMARAAGAVTLLDASQSLGHVDVRPEEISAAMVAFAGHKGLLGPSGTGGLYVSPALELKQILAGGTGVRSDLAHHPLEMPVRLEAGTPNTAGLAGLASAVEYLLESPPDAASTAALTAHLRRQLASIAGVRLYPSSSADQTGVVSFSIDGWDPGAAGDALRGSFDIECRTGLHCAPLIHRFIGSDPAGTIRFSLSRFTTEAEVDSAARAVRSLAG
jgi:cysteine desulfurase / selenocysteine lyase